MGLLKRFFLLASLIFISGCTSSAHSLLTANLPKTATDPKHIEVFFENPVARSRPLAVVSVSRSGENALWAVEALKIEAAELGADAICHLEMNYSTGLMPSLRVKGVAVKYE